MIKRTHVPFATITVSQYYISKKKKKVPSYSCSSRVFKRSKIKIFLVLVQYSITQTLLKYMLREKFLGIKYDGG